MTRARTLADLGGATSILPPPLEKADPNSVVFTKTGNGSASIKAGTYVNVNGTVIHFASATAITMPTLTAGTDYYVYVNTSGTAQAVEATGTWPTWFASYLNLTTYDNGIVSPPANSVLIGGFHYAPGGNGTWAPDIWSESPHNKPVRMEFDWPYTYPQAGGGGDTTPQINEYSFWDLKWRPSAPDPRGMTLVQDTFWCDIYLLNIDPAANGTSKNNVEIWGHDSNSNPSHWNIKHQLANFGKRLPSQGEFTELAMGTTCEASRGNAPVTTGLSTTNTGTENSDEKFTSRWGVIQSTGVAWVYALDVGGSKTQSQNFDFSGGPTYWSTQGQIHQRLGERPGTIIMGGRYSNGVNSGYGTVLYSGVSGINGEYFTGRGVCEHRLQV